jgi:hypothetical protein
MLDMPIVRCPRCGLRQYAPATYTCRAECVRCDAPLQPAKVATAPIYRRPER